ncbi:hypothetical protein [Polaromonas sp.]|uniref:hypothetical protein n=1 Tax=Polaromonas sp. TaxID=1869339 RepID=UPI00352BCFDA
MDHEYNVALAVGASLSAIAFLLHVGIIIGGAPWYRFFGAGERMTAAVAAGRRYPAMVTASIAAVFALWVAYALSGAGLISTLPMLRLGLCAITAIYVLRGLAVIPVLAFGQPKSVLFIVWSSVISLTFGATHLIGLIQVWKTL